MFHWCSGLCSGDLVGGLEGSDASRGWFGVRCHWFGGVTCWWVRRGRVGLVWRGIGVRRGCGGASGLDRCIGLVSMIQAQGVMCRIGLG